MGKREEITTEFLLAKSQLRSSCLRNCFDKSNESALMSDMETTCLQNCGLKIQDFLKELSKTTVDKSIEK